MAERWTADTGIEIKYIEVPLGEINQKVLLEAVSKTGSFDIALPATFGIPDLAESGILVNLDQLSQKYEPAGYQDDVLYSAGDFYKGSLYGYQTDGDTYLDVLPQGLARQCRGEQEVLRQERLRPQGAGDLGAARRA